MISVISHGRDLEKNSTKPNKYRLFIVDRACDKLDVNITSFWLCVCMSLRPELACPICNFIMS